MKAVNRYVLNHYRVFRRKGYFVGDARGVMSVCVLGLILLLLTIKPRLDSSRIVPVELLQARLMDSLYDFRGQWEMQGRPKEVRWSNPDGQWYQVLSLQGWPQVDDCATFWEQMMGIQHHQWWHSAYWQDTHCVYELFSARQMRYFPLTGTIEIVQLEVLEQPAE